MANILLIEDDPDVRQLLHVYLVQAGHAVRQAENGRQGLEIIESAPPELIVTDVLMPSMDGLELLSVLKKAQPGAKVIVISGGGSTLTDVYLKAALRLGASTVLSKPFSRATFLDAVDTTFRKSA